MSAPSLFSLVNGGKKMSSFKQMKLYVPMNISEGDDTISSLPDCILHHILSFLPTKDAVATCVLSTRWKHLWTSVSNIDFDDACLYLSAVNDWFPLKVTCFMNFVERVLFFRDVSNLKRFRLSCRVCFSASHVHAWISSAVKRNVQELDLCLFVEDPFMLPLCVFCSESLTVIKIEMNCVLKLPASFYFPCLKTLHLSLVTFPSDGLTQMLFSSFTVLEELAILDCEWMNLKSIKIGTPTLKSLTIDDLPCFELSDLHGCEINIESKNLMFLNYIGYLSNEIFLHSLPSLVNASMEILSHRHWNEEIAYRAVKLLRGLCSVTSARISSATIESIVSAESLLQLLPVFGNLMRLELTMQFQFQSIRALMKLLHFMPNLQSLWFVQGLGVHINNAKDDWILLSVPECLLSSIKRINFRKFYGNSTEISFINFLLRNAFVLEDLTIHFSQLLSGNMKKQEDIKNELQMLPKSATHCTITVF